MAKSDKEAEFLRELGKHFEKDKDKSGDTTVEAVAEEEVEKEAEKNEARINNIFEILKETILASDMSADEKNSRLAMLQSAMNKKVNLLLVGPTGSGKSSTINALFDMRRAEVGTGANPKTYSIDKYELGNLTIWDTPGLGDGKSDSNIEKQLVKVLNDEAEDGSYLIDLVLVIVDASSKDLGTPIHLISDVLIPAMGDDARDRILVALNQADVAMKGRHWDSTSNEPDETLTEFLKEKERSIRKRIRLATGVNIRPVYYCAGYTEPDGEQCEPYNLSKLLYFIMESIPEEKCMAVFENINPNEDAWLHDDEEQEYRKETFNDVMTSIFNTYSSNIGLYAAEGELVGQEILGIPGMLLGKALGGAFGVFAGTVENISYAFA